jgi:hypothetical protein
MNILFLRCVRRWAICVLVSVGGTEAHGAAPPIPDAAPEATKEKTMDFLHDLLPVAWQKRPQQRFNAFTEMTDEGKKRRIPTPEQPMYYYSPPPQFAQLGVPIAGEKPPPIAELEAAMKKALAANGYLPIADDRQRPDILIVLAFGSSTRGMEPDDETRQEALMHYIERARLVGGDRFAGELLKAIKEAAVFGTPPPVTMFVKAFDSDVVERSVDIAGDNLYFVTATAFDFAGVEKRQPISLWQTRMTLESQGVSMEEALSPLILNAGAALGRETPEPRLIKKRLDREGHVEVGETKVIGESKPAGSSPPPAEASGSK